MSFNGDVSAWDTSSVSTIANGKCNDGIVLDRGKEVGFFLLQL